MSGWVMMKECMGISSKLIIQNLKLNTRDPSFDLYFRGFRMTGVLFWGV
jgi:hypothetical protein